MKSVSGCRGDKDADVKRAGCFAGKKQGESPPKKIVLAS